jgi:heme/copper-type cytochrome/quinol oxidase subunit 4
MADADRVNQKKGGLRSQWRTLLLMVQILLPLAGFIALQNGNGVWAGVIAALFALSMLVLVVLG